MATAGGLMAVVMGDRALHYPASFLFLPSLCSLIDAFLYLVPGSLLVPLCLVRISAPMEPGARARPMARAVRAYAPTFCASLANIAALIGWQWVVQKGPNAWIHSLLPGGSGDVVTWVLGVVGSYAIASVIFYVPIVAIRPATGFREAIGLGIQEGIRFFWFTLFFLLLFVLPALPFLAAAQLRPAVIIAKFRPELIGILIGIYSVVSSFSMYLILAAAARLHWAAAQKEAP